MKLSHRMMNLVCIKTVSDGRIQRIRHIEAEEQVNNGDAIYVPCRVWRDATTHEQRVNNARIHTYRRKKGSGRGRSGSSRIAD
jgi:hypothetical protein